MRVNRNYIGDIKTIKHAKELLLLMSAMTGDKRFEDLANDKSEKEISNMCEALDRIEQKGIEKGMLAGRQEGRKEGRQEGLAIGVDMMSRLIEILIKEGDLDSLSRVVTDKAYRQELFKKYDIQ